MTIPIYKDAIPGAPKILFIGTPQSTHTHAWIDLLADSAFNVCLFSSIDGKPPDDWEINTYITSFWPGKNTKNRKNLYAGKIGILIFNIDRVLIKLKIRTIKSRERWLADLLRRWKPDIIHTLGLFDEQGGILYYNVRKKFGLQKTGKWILQTRGGSDLALRRHNPEFIPVIRQAFLECHQIICDNTTNIRYAQELGISPEKFASIVPVPGTGGIDISGLSEITVLPSLRDRIIIWPKAYECPWSKALPVIEAIQIAWNKIQPCRIFMFSVSSEVKEWYYLLPVQIRNNCFIRERIPRKDVLELMKQSRVVLIPSLIDGIPNSLYEAMACRAVPIVSPLETIMPLMKEGENVIYTRNLYPDEIANALIKAMNDNYLADSISDHNMKLVSKIANRQVVKEKIINYYKSLS